MRWLIYVICCWSLFVVLVLFACRLLSVVCYSLLSVGCWLFVVVVFLDCWLLWLLLLVLIASFWRVLLLVVVCGGFVVVC